MSTVIRGICIVGIAAVVGAVLVVGVAAVGLAIGRWPVGAGVL